MRLHQCCLLAAGSHRRTKAPCSLWSFSNGKSILDWQIHAFERALPKNRIHIVVGHGYEKIIASHPHLHFNHALNWQHGNALQSFLQAPLELGAPVIAMYGDTIFHAETLSTLASLPGDVVIAIDSVWKERFRGRSQEDIQIAETLDLAPWGEVEYSGLIKFSPQVMAWLQQKKATDFEGKTFIDLIHELRACGFELNAHDIAGQWAEMNEPNDLVHFILGNKAETLRRIQPQLTKSIICDQFICHQSEWKKEPLRILNGIAAQFPAKRLIIRSSAFEEDSWETANAGVFASILDIDSSDPDALAQAIEDVFASYQNPADDAQVLIQPFVSETTMSGVIFTADLVTGAPWYVINYDDASGRTDSVTSGQHGELRTVTVFRQNKASVRQIDPRLEAVIEAAQELENILGYSKLDIEFALGHDQKMYTFQVRPIVVKHDMQADEKRLATFLHSAHAQFQRWQKAAPHILGDSTVFSGMTDWNPAEIIGSRPNTLAISLYRHLVTDAVWARQRAEFGYRDVRPQPLVYSFCGQPYVDCRASFNSFIPRALADEVAERLVNVYLDLLREQPHLHDKVELELLFTIWLPDFWQESNTRFAGRDISPADLKTLEQALQQLTARALERLDKDIAPIKTLAERFRQVTQSALEPIEKAWQLIEDCRQYGTPAFAHAARAGFIAITILKYLVRQGYMSAQRMLDFQASIPTVASDLQQAISAQAMNPGQLLKTWGHLRPGTYDVNQKAYWEDPDFYLPPPPHVQQAALNKSFQFTRHEIAGLENFLAALPTDINSKQLIQYLGQAIQAREKTKFQFSRNISATLDLCIAYGKDALGLSREEVGHLCFEDIDALRTGNLDQEHIPALIQKRKSFQAEKQLAKLPGFIRSGNDFFAFEQEKSIANYITQHNVIAELVFINRQDSKQLNNKIIVIPNADPGFDWIFSHKIAGLITQYGGANSHMAIRCAELGIPAAIGIGDKAYENLAPGRIMLDCLKERLEYV